MCPTRVSGRVVEASHYFHQLFRRRENRLRILIVRDRESIISVSAVCVRMLGKYRISVSESAVRYTYDSMLYVSA